MTLAADTGFCADRHDGWTPARIGLAGTAALPPIANAPDVVGLDFAVLTTWSRDVTGVQIAPITLARTSTGIRLGLLNLYGRECFECPSAYVSSQGLSMGLVNSDSVANGVFMGGFNAQMEFTGVQLGLVNLAEDGTGLQIGAVNLAMRSFRGVQLGLVNVIKDGAIPNVMVGFNARF